MERTLGRSLSLLGSLLFLLMPTPAQAYSIFGDEVENFLKERVTFGGFIENVTGLAVGPGDRRHFNTSNHFIMNRLTFQAEFNLNLSDEAKLFLSWRFAKEPRYNFEARSRRRSVAPAANGSSLPNTFYDDYSPKPWEAVLDLLPTDRLSIRVGRQFISWGEADGFRLLDIINPQDSTFPPPAAPNLFSLDETRIPLLGLKTLYTLPPGKDTVLEFFAMPGYDDVRKTVDDVVSSNDTGDRRLKFGRWSAHPETRMPFGRLFTNGLAGRPTIIPSVSKIFPEAGDNWRFGGRVVQTIGKLNFGIGYLYIYNPQGADQVFKLTGTSPGPGPTTIATIKLVNDRTSIYAGHFNYPLDELKTTVRGELALYPNKPWNISKFPGNSFRAGPHPRHLDGTVEKDTIRYILGLDRSFFIPLLHPDDPFRAFSFSFQLFQNVILDHEDGIRQFHTAQKIRTISSALSLRVNTGYLGDTWLPDIFVTVDPEGYAAFNPALSYAPAWNEKAKFTLTSVHYYGRNKFKSLGLFDEKDSIYLKMRYQF